MSDSNLMRNPEPHHLVTLLLGSWPSGTRWDYKCCLNWGKFAMYPRITNTTELLSLILILPSIDQNSAAWKVQSSVGNAQSSPVQGTWYWKGTTEHPTSVLILRYVSRMSQPYPPSSQWVVSDSLLMTEHLPLFLCVCTKIFRLRNHQFPHPLL